MLCLVAKRTLWSFNYTGNDTLMIFLMILKLVTCFKRSLTTRTIEFITTFLAKHQAQTDLQKIFNIDTYNNTYETFNRTYITDRQTIEVFGMYFKK